MRLYSDKELAEILDQEIFRQISEAADRLGLECYVVGGFVRDIFLERPSNDIDVVVVGSGISVAQELKRMLGRKAHLSVFKNFGTAQVKIKPTPNPISAGGGLEVEFVGTRKESYSHDSRKPVVEDGTLEDDQNRRDFTINAMAICLNKSRFGELVDPFNGLADLEDGIIATPLEPGITFSDDPLRMLRCIRFATQLNFQIEEETFEALERMADRIKIVSGERIKDELNKIILSPHPSKGFVDLQRCGLLNIILPELAALDIVESRNGRTHKNNFYHTLEVLENVVKSLEFSTLHSSLWLRWAALLHDVGKTKSKRWDPVAGWTFHNHNSIGAKMVPQIFRRLMLPMDAKMRYVQKLVDLHMRPIAIADDVVTDSAVRRLLNDAGEDIDDLMTLCEADITSKNEVRKKLFLENFRMVREKLADLKEKDYIRLLQPVIDGNEIMEMFHLKPSREVGVLKQYLKDAVLDNRVENEREPLMALLMEKAKQMNLILMLLFALQVIANPVDELLERIDKGASAKFRTELVKGDRDFFELDQQGRKVVVRGNTWVNIASGINWYLKYYAGIHLSWNQMQAKLPAVLPAVKAKERHETDLTLRYAFNYCTFSYSMAFWDWKRWEQEIDWLCLHGVNLPLAVVGEECVWRNMLLKLGYTEEEVGQFIAGPAFLAWWEMNNLEGWGGPLPLSWYQRQETLQKQILARMKRLGMHPVLPGYSGMVPHDFYSRENSVENSVLSTWNGFQRPANLLPTDARFAEIAKLYYDELTRLFGKADYYSMDPFHESADDAAIDYAKAGEAMMQAMKRVNPKAVWVIQGWTENPRPAMVDGMKTGDLLVLDLFSECRPMFGAPSIWRRAEGYKQHQWLFCLLENFGANVGLHGRMDQLLDNFYNVECRTESSDSLELRTLRKGIGFTMEGSENNPVMFELMSELPWRPEKFAKEDWIKNYVRARYGILSSLTSDLSPLEQAWQILASTIYNCPAGNNQQGPHESIFCGRPSLNNFQASSWSKMKNYYDPASTLEAARLMNSVAGKFRGNNNFEYDLVDITRQALADQARKQYHRVIADYKAFAISDFRRSSQRFLDMLLMQDRLLGTRSEFRLGHWTQAALNCGSTPEEKALYEWNARVQITTWGNRYCADTGGLRDYAHKEWQGLLKDFYYVRWKNYFDALAAQMEEQTQPQPDLLGGGPNANKTSAELMSMARPQEIQLDWYALEEPWTLRQNPYTAEPVGSPVDIAKDAIELMSNIQCSMCNGKE